MTAKHIQEAWDKLRAERDELAAQAAVMRDALSKCRFDSLNMSFSDMDQIRSAFAMKNPCAAILRQRDARTLREAACIADQWGLARKPSQGGNALRNCANHIRSIADELERKNG